ncbi:LysR family transcriptional regulator [Ureibacillus sp. NPDC094379]
MDVRQLQYFKEIVKQGSISKAAEALHIAQPPLSQLLKKLETELGTTLIHRYRQKWELTETGQVLYQYAEQMLSKMSDVIRQIEEIEQGAAGTVRIGVSSSCSNMLVDLIAMYRKLYPNVKISIYKGDSEELSIQLQQREIDIALMLRPSNSEVYEMKILKKQPAVLIIPASWSEAISTQPTVEQIATLPFIMLGAMGGYSFNENILQTFDLYHVQPNIMIECKDISMVVALVSRGLGISIIPKMDYTTPTTENVTLIEMEYFDFAVEPVMVKLKDEPIPKAAVQFLEMIKTD